MLSVIQRQRDLSFLNYDTGGIDGIAGTKTKKAYYYFQRDFDCSMLDGIYGQETNSRLIEVIKTIQTKLGCTMIDGIVGNETITKCKEFQKAHGLVADGICGARTRNALDLPKGLSWDDIKHFKKSEFACGDGCGYDDISLRLVQILEKIREHFGGKPVIITSGCRCSKYNNSLAGSVKGSKHLTGQAVDFYIPGVPTATLLAYCQSLVNQGLLSYTYTNNTNMRWCSSHKLVI